ncbi:hypothetical protein [Desulfuromonas sp. AOP6]|uniref:hypothetical protein n=1 Tax=Desulfuromonas sp. AOP6 TaxID=1566351 RepID=UPI0012DBE886|nr:hypothetical protein [Desulfuromonas sp. AOP6]
MKIYLVALFVLFNCSITLAADVIDYEEWKDYQQVNDKVVIVKSDIYGGDLTYSATLKGKVRNITQDPMKNIVVAWLLFDENNKLFPNRRYYSDYFYDNEVFSYKIDYLDSKTTEDFQVGFDLYSGIGSDTAQKIRDAVFADRYKILVFQKKQ